MANRNPRMEAKVATEIAALGAQSPGDETRLLKLRNRGMDAYSGLPLPELVDRVGAAASAPVLAALADPADQMAALRWVLRGLPVALAIRKRQLQRAAHPGRGRGLRRTRAERPSGPAPVPVPLAVPPPAPGPAPARRVPPLTPAAAAALLAEPAFRGYFAQALAEALPDREQQAFDLRYGLTTGRPLSLARVGEPLGVSSARAGQLLTRGWRRIGRQAARQRRAGLPPGPGAACAWIVAALTPAPPADAEDGPDGGVPSAPSAGSQVNQPVTEAGAGRRS